MKRFYFLFAILLVAPNLLACQSQTISQTVVSSDLKNTNTTNLSKEEIKEISKIFTNKDSLSYNGFDVVKLKKKVKLDYSPEMKSKPETVEVSYAVLKKKNRIINTFTKSKFHKLHQNN